MTGTEWTEPGQGATEICDWCHVEFDHANREDDSELCRACWERFVLLTAAEVTR